MPEIKLDGPVKAQYFKDWSQIPPAGAFAYFSDSRGVGRTGMIYCCPCGCGDQGSLAFRPLAIGSQSKASWIWDNNEESPTLSPSVHHVGHWHGFLQNGFWKQA